jgi:argininosuccinate synthase
MTEKLNLIPLGRTNRLDRIFRDHDPENVSEVRDRTVGIESREIYDWPASTAPIEVARELERVVTIAEQNSPLSLLGSDLATYEPRTTNQFWSNGFVENWGIPTLVANARARKNLSTPLKQGFAAKKLQKRKTK